MNPYLEHPRVWHDFHQSFAIYCRQELATQIRPDFIVTVEDNIYVREAESHETTLAGRSDLSVVDSSAKDLTSEPMGATATIGAPVTGVIRTIVEDVTENHLEIRDRNSRQLITVIEILSPTNKRPGKDRDQFEYKRNLLLNSDANYVEIDLLRGYPRLPVDNLPPCDAYAMVSRPEQRPRVGLWPVSLREPLPTIPIPLKPSVADAKLDLQAILHQTYDASGYEDYIYSSEIEPALSEENAAWARGVLEQAR